MESLRLLWTDLVFGEESIAHARQEHHANKERYHGLGRHGAALSPLGRRLGRSRNNCFTRVVYEADKPARLIGV